MPLDGPPSVYAYIDYRAYLKDHFTYSKATYRHYSYRYFARKAGLSSSNYLKLVMDGQRNLGAATIPKFAKALKLSKTEAAFFSDLVAFAQAETLAERNRAFERVSAHRRFRSAKKLEGPLFKYLTRWYYPVVRELAARADFDEDPKWIAKQTLPRISTRQARAALRTLEELGLLVRDEKGRLSRGEPSLSTGHEARAVVIPAYHRQMIERAADALENVSPDARHVTALTVCVSADALADMKERVGRFIEEMLERCDSDPNPEQVMQLCVQLFPLSRAATDD